MPVKRIPREIIVTDCMQSRYRYFRTEPVGVFSDPEFKPDLTPAEMLALGVFGGHYFIDKPKEFPRKWFIHTPVSLAKPDAALNFFKVNASQSLAVWRKKKWIHPDDPRGWFEWYCRYYLGRRHGDDVRQICRWKAMRRHSAQIARHCRPFDLHCRRRQRQALLHWAYDSRKI